MDILNKILNKGHLRIIVTDSGLGGLSVHAILDKQLRKLNISSKIEIIFYNSVAHHDYGYNTMSDETEKLRVFDSALTGMLKFNPDLILIACNTLSVLYPKTEFFNISDIPILEIIDLSIELILENIKSETNRNIILFGTETTINSNQHKNNLLLHGILGKKIISQKCNLLESEIQIDPQSPKVNYLIEKYVDEAFHKIQIEGNNSLAVLCCTHYGYSKNIFQKKLNDKFNREILVLNPNEKMASKVIENLVTNNEGSSEITNTVVSKVDINESEIKTFGNLLAKDSESVSKALRNYELKKDLFII